MKLTQRTLILSAVVIVALAVAAVVLGVDGVVVALVLAVLVLAGLVAWGRARSQARADEIADWADGGDEWGLTDAEQDDDVVDLDDRLSGFGARTDEIPSRRGLIADDDFEQPDVVWEDEDATTYGGAATYGRAEADDLGAAYDDRAAGYDHLDEELEELVEEYATEEPVEDFAPPAYEEEPYEPARPTRASIFAAPGIIDESAVTSDDAILAVSDATRLQYDNVLSREDANAETREILSRVASLLAKYE